MGYAWLHRQQVWLMVFLRYITIYTKYITYGLHGCAERLEKNHARTVSLRKRQAVSSSSGAFYSNRNKVGQYVTNYLDGVALGAIGDDGSGIKLGQSVDAGSDLMDSISA